jgi:hypothetical protein
LNFEMHVLNPSNQFLRFQCQTGQKGLNTRKMGFSHLSISFTGTPLYQREFGHSFPLIQLFHFTTGATGEETVRRKRFLLWKCRVPQLSPYVVVSVCHRVFRPRRHHMTLRDRAKGGQPFVSGWWHYLLRPTNPRRSSDSVDPLPFPSLLVWQLPTGSRRRMSHALNP